MLEKISYPNINAKLKGMHSKILEKEELEDLLKQNTIKDAIISLKSKLSSLDDLNIDAKRIELESGLDDLIIEDINKIYRILDKKTKIVFDAYILKYKIKILKIVWKDLVIGRQIGNIQEFRNWIMLFKDLQGIENVKNQEEFLYKIKDKNLQQIFSNSQDLFELESLLSKYYFENLYLKASGQSNSLKNIISDQIDMINIFSIYRCKKYYGFYEKKYFINYGNVLKKSKIEEIESLESIQDIKQILKNAKYKEIVDASINEDNKKYIYKKYKKCFRDKQFDVSIIIAYLYFKEIEQSNIVTIIEGIRYKMNREEILKELILD